MTSDHQRYLEAPYTRAAKAEEAYEQWCDAYDHDPDDPEAQDEYEAWIEEQEYNGPDPDDARDLAYERMADEREHGPFDD